MNWPQAETKLLELLSLSKNTCTTLKVLKKKGEKLKFFKEKYDFDKTLQVIREKNCILLYTY